MGLKFYGEVAYIFTVDMLKSDQNGIEILQQRGILDIFIEVKIRPKWD